MKTIIIIDKELFKKKFNIFPKNFKFYYLSDDYESYIDFKNTISNQLLLKNLTENFHEVLEVIKKKYMELFYKLGKKNSSLSWWGSFIASRSSTSTPLLRNIVYLYCVYEIINDLENAVFIVDDDALAKCIREIANNKNFQVKIYTKILKNILKRLKFYIDNFFIIIFFLFYGLVKSIYARYTFKNKMQNLNFEKRRILICSWVTQGNLTHEGKFNNRNFGMLPQWLKENGYEVWNMPMFFNVQLSFKKILYQLKKYEDNFLIPEYYLQFIDYLLIIIMGFKHYRLKLNDLYLDNLDVTKLIIDAKNKSIFSYSLFCYNQSYPLLKRLSKKNISFERFIYPHENNPPEKVLILGVRQFFQKSKIIGYQHTAFIANQMMYQMSNNEDEFHPLPDKIVVSGPQYKTLYRDAGFPSDILVNGPNLRFTSVYIKKSLLNKKLLGKNNNVLIPLTYSYDLATEILIKVRDALKNMNDYKVYVRSHPLLSKKKIIAFKKKYGMEDFEFADNGIIQEYFPSLKAMISIGGTIADLEAVVFGVPLIRVIPDNTFYLSCFHQKDYPLKPINSSQQIKHQIMTIHKILSENEDIFIGIGEKVKRTYYTKQNNKNYRVFLM